ncbi:TPA: glycosyltransferase family 2 protein, partial [Escherichia coli]
MINKNKVSVIIPVYNAEKYLGACIDSILEQTYKIFEIIIINDGSQDGTQKILDEYKNKYPAIFKIKHRENKGIVATLNELLDMATGVYIARMDADDIAHRERLRLQVEIMDADQKIACCGTNIKVFESAVNSGKIIKMPNSDEACKIGLLVGSCFAHPTVMMRSSIIKKECLYYKPRYQYAEDYEFWSRLANYGKFCNINIPLLYYRNHGNQISNIKKHIQADIHISIAIDNLKKQGIILDKDELGMVLFPQSSHRFLNAICYYFKVYFIIFSKLGVKIKYINGVFLRKFAYYCKIKINS